MLPHAAGGRTVLVEPRVPGGAAHSLSVRLAGLREVQRAVPRPRPQQAARVVTHVGEAVLHGEAVHRQPAALRGGGRPAA
jgi:hypothetical protein